MGLPWLASTCELASSLFKIANEYTKGGLLGCPFVSDGSRPSPLALPLARLIFRRSSKRLAVLGRLKQGILEQQQLLQGLRYIMHVFHRGQSPYNVYPNSTDGCILGSFENEKFMFPSMGQTTWMF